MLKKRLEDIYKTIEKKGSVEVAKLAKDLNVTEKTIRLDLETLEKHGLIRRIHGGAVLVGPKDRFYDMLSKKGSHTEQKKAIALKAYEYIEDGDIIYLDSGTTIYELACLIDKEVTVITNDPYIAWKLLNNDKVELYVVGGKLKRVGEQANTYVGNETVKIIKSLKANKLFSSSSCFNIKQGLTVFSTEEAEVKKAALSICNTNYVLMDYSKFNKTAIGSVCSIDKIDVLITDSTISDECIELIRNENINLEIA